MIQSNDGGANISTDGGRTWSSQMNQPTAEIYGVWLDEQFPYKLYGAQQDDTTVIISSRADPTNRDDWRIGPGCETGPIMPHPEHPDIVYGSCKGQYGVMDMKTGQEKNYWVGAQSLYGNPAQGSDLSLPARLADGDLAARSRRPLLRIAVPAPHARQGRDLGEDLAGSHRASRLLPGRERRADHARRDRRRVLQHALRDRGVAARARRDLDRARTTGRSTSRATTARRGRTSRRRICRRRTRAVHRRRRRIAKARRTTRSIATCSATTSRTSTEPTTTARPGRG